MRNRTWLVVLAIAVVATALAARHRYRNPPDYLSFMVEWRKPVIENHLAQLPDAIVIAGDSLVERNATDTLCGRPVINAGISGATAEHMAEIAPLLRGRDVILAAGVNDLQLGTDPADFRRTFRALVDDLKPVAVIGIAGNRPNPYEAIIREERGTATMIEGLPAAMLPDGLHYDLKGAGEWRRRLEVVC